MNQDNGVRLARFVRIIDGDTFIALIDLTPKGIAPAVKIEASIRVHNWSAAELSHEEGPIFRDLFHAQLVAAKRIDVQLKTMSFQRIVAAVFVDGTLFAGLLNRQLIQLRRQTQS